MEADPLIGRQIETYTLIDLVGRGGMGVVYRAVDNSGNTVAVKLIAPELAQSKDFRERFLREAEVALEHPNVIPVYGAGEEDGLLYIAMHLVEGPNLKDLIAAEMLTAKRTLSLLAQTAAALDFAHANEIVHRDVKPQNILVESSSDHVFLTDFGLVKRASGDSSFTSSGHLLGSAHYVPPEQIEGRGVDGRADVYALGCVLYECLTGRIPYERDEELSVLWAHVNAPVPRPSESEEQLPTAIDKVVAKAMAKDPNDRYLTAGDMVAELAGVLGISESRVRSPWAASQIARPRSRLRPSARLAPAPIAVGQSLASMKGFLVGAAAMVALVAIALGLSDRTPQQRATPTAQRDARNPEDVEDIVAPAFDRKQKPRGSRAGAQTVVATPLTFKDFVESTSPEAGASAPVLQAVVPDDSALGQSVIVFTSSRRYAASQRSIGASMDMFVMRGDGSGVTNLSPKDPRKSDSFPVLSSCGHLSFVRFDESGSGTYELFNLAPDGTALYHQEGWQGWSNQDWSPDCSSLLYVAAEGLATMRPDGSNRKLLFNDSRVPANPRWSPDGSRVAFDLEQDPKNESGNIEIYSINSDGTNLTRLTNASAFDSRPVWSPDGQQIAFRRGAAGLGGDGDVWVMNADGSDPERLTEAVGDDLPVGWSPDGEHILFFTDRETRASVAPSLQGDIYIMDADGSDERDLIPDAGGHEGWLTWQPPVYRKISARVGDGTLSGRVRAIHRSCERDQRIHVERQEGGGWRVLGSVTTTATGSFDVTMPEPGVYRAHLELSTASGGFLCGIATSQSSNA